MSKPKHNQMPSGEPMHPSIRRELDEMWDAIRALQSPTGPDVDQVQYTEKEITFSYPGYPRVNVSSPFYQVRHQKAYITEVRLSLGTTPSSGSASFVLQVRVNGTNQQAITYTYNDQEDRHMLVDDIQIEVEEWDRISVVPTTVPSGLQDVTVQMVLSIPSDGE